MTLIHHSDEGGHENARGQTLVEFALASTLLFSVLFGILLGAIAVFRYNTVSDLAQEGARWASVRGATAPVPLRADEAAVRTYVRSRSLGGATLAVTTNANPSSLSPGQAVRVIVSQSVTGFRIGPFRTLTVQGTAEMVMAR
jgi:Flp pilus assembly protein TadG